MKSSHFRWILFFALAYGLLSGVGGIQNLNESRFFPALIYLSATTLLFVGAQEFVRTNGRDVHFLRLGFYLLLITEWIVPMLGLFVQTLTETSEVSFGVALVFLCLLFFVLDLPLKLIRKSRNDKVDLLYYKIVSRIWIVLAEGIHGVGLLLLVVWLQFSPHIEPDKSGSLGQSIMGLVLAFFAVYCVFVVRRCWVVRGLRPFAVIVAATIPAMLLLSFQAFQKFFGVAYLDTLPMVAYCLGAAGAIMLADCILNIFGRGMDLEKFREVKLPTLLRRKITE